MAKISTAKQAKKRSDDGVFEVEKIVNQQLKYGLLYYIVQWKGYPTEKNTAEQPHRLMCNSELKNFSAETFQKRFDNSNIREILETSSTMSDEKFLGSGNCLAAIGRWYISRSTLTFAEQSPLDSYRRFLAAMLFLENEWAMYTVPTMDFLISDIDRYTSELMSRLVDSPNYPNICISFGSETPHPSKYIPPPPPHFSITLDQLHESSDSQVTKSKDQGFDGLHPFMELTEGKRAENSEKLGMGARQPEQLEYPELLMLKYINDSGWVLVSVNPVQCGSRMMELCGVIRDEATAHESYIDYGFLISHTSIFQLGNSGRILDQTYLYDFSKFISHSCDPNCSVKLEEVEGPLEQDDEPIPKLVVVANRDIKKNSPLTIDFFKGFENDVNGFFSRIKNPSVRRSNGRLTYLQQQMIGFIGCTCNSENCRQVLYVDRATARCGEDKREEVLRNLPADRQFKGSKIDIGYQ